MVKTVLILTIISCCLIARYIFKISESEGKELMKKYNNQKIIYSDPGDEVEHITNN